MDPNTVQNIIGAAYVQKLDQELRPQSPFAAYDVLTPDEPSPAWQLAKHFLKVLANRLSSRGFQTTQTVSRQAFNSQSGDSQTAAHL